MASTTDRLSTFVSRRLLGALDVHSEQVRDGAVLFADVQGYSQLADRLVREQGALGVETLARILAATLGPLVDCYEHHGGEVVAFAGDAIVVLFCQDDGPDVVQTAAEAALAGESVMDGLRRMDPSLPLARQVITAGTLNLSAVGEEPRFAVVSGPPLRRVSALLGVVSAGRTVLDGSARRRLQGRVDHQGMLLDLPTSQSQSRFRAVRDALGQPISVGATARFVPSALHARLRQNDWYAELRAVTVLFVRLPDQQPLIAGRLAKVVERVQSVLAKHLGVLAEVVDDDKGMVLVGAFGLPHPEVFQPQAPVLAALEIARALEPFIPGIGVASGRVYFGELGGRNRRGLSLLGSVTNLAARMMMLGVGVFCDEDNARAVRGVVSFGPVRTHDLKGFADPVRIYPALAQRETSVRVVGRTDVRVRLRSDEPGLVLLAGEPGAGRSALLAELDSQMRVTGTVQRRDVPGGAWRDVLSEDAVERAGEMAPLLNPVLSLELEDTEATSILSGPVRAACLVKLLVELLAGGGRLVIDDGQWLDDVSLQVATLLAEQRPVVVSCRSRSGVLPAPLARLPAREVLHLESMPVSELSLLVRHQLELVDEPPAELVAWLGSRSHGLPGMVAELLRLVEDRGVLTLAKGAVRFFDPSALDALESPATIEAALAASLDRLPPGTREAVELASCIGVQVDGALWRQACAALGLTPSLSGAGHLAQRTDGGWAFKSETTRKAVHEGLLEERLGRLHRTLAEVMSEQDTAAAELAYHWGTAQQYDKALPLLERAWAEAQRQGVWRTARRQARRALRWLPEDAPAETRAGWHYRAAMACRGFGDTESANTDLLAAAELLSLSVPDSLSGFRWQLGSLGLRHLLDGLMRPRGGSATPLEASVMSLLSLARWLRNEPPEAQLATAMHAVSLARRSPEPVPAAMAFSMVAVALSRFPSVADRYLDEARGLAEALQEPTEWVDWCIGKMLVDFAHLRFDEAQQALSQVEHISQSLSNDALRAALLAIICCVDLVTGNADRCWARLRELTQLGERTGYLQALGWSRNIEASLWLAAGEPSEALRCAEQAEVPLEQRGDVNLLSSRALQAAAQLELGNVAEAIELVERLDEELASAPPIPATGLECVAIPAMVWHRVGEPAKARQAIERYRRYSANFPVTQQRARLLAAMISAEAGDLERVAQEARSRGLLMEESWARRLLGEQGGRIVELRQRFRAGERPTG